MPTEARSHSGHGLLSFRQPILQRSHTLCSQRRFHSCAAGESRDLNDYAFAPLGALAHYTTNTTGHPLATNLSVAMMYPKLAKRYGPVVTYDEKPSAHAQVEFGFDVDQVAEGNYASRDYHDLIGFEVPKPVLERAFADTYCIEMSSVSSALIWQSAAIATQSHRSYPKQPEWHGI